ncbi:signal peptidase I, partial [Cryobacterium frigoriphilum]
MTELAPAQVGVAATPPAVTLRDGWGWFVLSLLAHGYLVFVAALAACALVPLLAGLTGAVVLSSSMEPHISPGDVVLSQPYSTDDPAPLGRVVTFEAPTGSARPGPVLHRVVGVNDDDGSLITRGDANADADSAPLARLDILSTARLLVPWVGLPSYWLKAGLLAPLLVWLVLTAAAIAVEAASVGRGRAQRGDDERPRGPWLPRRASSRDGLWR